MIFIDSNIFIYAFIDEEHRGDACRDVLDQIAKGKITAVTTPVVMDEVIWALLKNNKRDSLRGYITNLYQLPNLQIVEVQQNLPLLALAFILEYNLRPHDAMHCAFMKQNEITIIATDDTDFDKIKGIKRMKI